MFNVVMGLFYLLVASVIGVVITADHKRHSFRGIEFARWTIYLLVFAGVIAILQAPVAVYFSIMVVAAILLAIAVLCEQSFLQ